MTDDRVLVWLSDLSDVTRPSNDDRPTPEKVRLYAGMLADFPNEAFTLDSLQAVTEKIEFFPSIGALRDLLGAWWRDNQPRSRLIAGPPPAARPWVHRADETTDEYLARRGLRREILDGYEVVTDDRPPPQPAT